MCGIVGYTGTQAAKGILFEGLRRLEYRGYDSAGIALNDNGRLLVRKKIGKLSVLTEDCRKLHSDATTGIGHTRWATHGGVTVTNAHPHVDCRGRLAIVHNGIIENYEALRKDLARKGHKFRSETDTEIIVHLVEENIKKGLLTATRLAAQKLEGAYALVVMERGSDTLIAARMGAPLVIGLGDSAGENFIASDIPALLPFTRSVMFLDEEEIAEVTPAGAKVFLMDGRPLRKAVQKITWDNVSAERGGHKHFMMKEILEQPEAVAKTVGTYIRNGKILFPETAGISDWLAAAPPSRVTFLACGTSFHAAMVAKYEIERYLRLPVETDVASELRYRHAVMTDRELMIAVSQSGETADTLAAVRRYRKKGRKIISICNVVGSTLTRLSDGVVYTLAGPEIGVASTKAFTTQLVSLTLLMLDLGVQLRRLKPAFVKAKLQALMALPAAIRTTLERTAPVINRIARAEFKKNHFLYLGRGPNFPIALEGALKLKEISYIHAEGYASGEMKHGPIALIDDDLPVLSIATADEVYPKVLSNMQEARARGGILIGLSNPKDRRVASLCRHVIEVPKVDPLIQPIVNVIPLQLLAYTIADLRGCDIDQPRNLAKSVTVE
ncbi:glutamine--fructose-6-phosphate transaminase (isomerizing) [bacterium]|nr:glutamine--fructose-6-phosphate transaminase (isomerizing) [bacterium]